MEYKKNIRNELMKRQELSFLIESVKNPTFNEMRKLISEDLKKPEELIDVYNILGKFGRKTFLIKAYIYDSKEDFEKIKNLSKTKKQRKLEKEKREVKEENQ